MSCGQEKGLTLVWCSGEQYHMHLHELHSPWALVPHTTQAYCPRAMTNSGRTPMVVDPEAMRGRRKFGEGMLDLLDAGYVSRKGAG